MPSLQAQAPPAATLTRQTFATSVTMVTTDTMSSPNQNGQLHPKRHIIVVLKDHAGMVPANSFMIILLVSCTSHPAPRQSGFKGPPHRQPGNSVDIIERTWALSKRPVVEIINCYIHTFNVCEIIGPLNQFPRISAPTVYVYKLRQ